MTVDVERVSGGTLVVCCPSCGEPVLDSDDATLVEGRVVHDHCDIDPDDPQTLAFWSPPGGESQ